VSPMKPMGNDTALFPNEKKLAFINIWAVQVKLGKDKDSILGSTEREVEFELK